MLNMVLFFFLLDKGGQPIVGGYAEHDYTHDIQQVGEVDNPFNDDKPYPPTGILDGRLFEQLVSPIIVYHPFFRVIRGIFLFSCSFHDENGISGRRPKVRGGQE